MIGRAGEKDHLRTTNFFWAPRLHRKQSGLPSVLVTRIGAVDLVGLTFLRASIAAHSREGRCGSISPRQTLVRWRRQ